VSVIGKSADWADLLEPMVPVILNLVVATWEELPSPAPDEGEDKITNELCRALRQNRSARSLPFQIHPQMVELEPMAGEDMGRMDIVFIPMVPREDIYFCLEAKRLNVNKNGESRAYAAEYVTYGMLRFINGQYAKSVLHGGMLAYVLDGNLPRAIANVALNVRRQCAALCMNEPGRLLPSAILSDDRARETHHQRAHESTLFRIHHLFMDN